MTDMAIFALIEREGVSDLPNYCKYKHARNASQSFNFAAIYLQQSEKMNTYVEV